MKNVLTIVFVAILAIAATGCSKDNSANEPGDTKTVRFLFQFIK